MDPSQLNYAAIAVAALVSFVIGGVWYSPILFARAWLREARLDEAEIRQADMARVFGLSFACTLVMAFNLAAFIGPRATPAFGAFAGAAAGLGWVCMSLGVIYLFERRPLKLWLINGGYQLLAYTLMGLILGSWH